MGPLPILREQDQDKTAPRHGAEELSPVLSQMQANRHHQRIPAENSNTLHSARRLTQSLLNHQQTLRFFRKEHSMITIQQLTKHYDGFSLNISLEVPRGRVVGIVGKNGAGKSTTLKAILGLVQPEGCSVRVFGKEAAQLTGRDKQRIGVTFSESGFSHFFTPSA